MPVLDSAREAILGLWRLTLYQDREDETETWSQPYGRRPVGLGIYHPSGFLSMQLLPDPASPSPGPPVAYIGGFAVREAHQRDAGFSGVLEHHIEAASHPELLAEDSARPFVIVGNTLGLGDGRTWRRVFKRLEWMPSTDA